MNNFLAINNLISLILVLVVEVILGCEERG